MSSVCQGNIRGRRTWELSALGLLEERANLSNVRLVDSWVSARISRASIQLRVVLALVGNWFVLAASVKVWVVLLIISVVLVGGLGVLWLLFVTDQIRILDEIEDLDKREWRMK